GNSLAFCTLPGSRRPLGAALPATCARTLRLSALCSPLGALALRVTLAIALRAPALALLALLALRLAAATALLALAAMFADSANHIAIDVALFVLVVAGFQRHQLVVVEFVRLRLGQAA